MEGFRRILSEHGQGERIDRIEVADAGVLRNTSAQALRRSLEGRRFEEPVRHGKWLQAMTNGPMMLFHFGMSGGLVWAPDSDRHRHDRVIFGLEQGELRYRDQRKLQGLWLARSDREAKQIMGPLGPDALRLGRREFVDRLASRRGRLKPVLMNQEVVAGLGNLLVDEILWRSGLNPGRRADQLEPDELEKLHRTMQRVLKDSVAEGRVPPKKSWLTGARDQAPPMCPRCGHELEQERVGGRSSYWCPRCQPK